MQGIFLACALGLFAADEAAVLTTRGLADWKPDSGWIDSFDAKLDPADEKRLAGSKGLGVLLNGPSGKARNLFSKLEHGDAKVRLEFMVPKGSNSGVYFQGRYEIQVLDSWGVKEPKYSDCGGIYQRWANDKGFEGRAPAVNAALQPGKWQTLEATFRAPRFDAAGKKTAAAKFVKVELNGKTIHENQEVSGPTRAAAFEDERPSGPLMLQGDHGPVAYRNVHVEKTVID